HRHVGIVLQTRLHRTEEDLSRIPRGIRVRLVIGIYNEPAEHAIRDKRQMKKRLLDAAKLLFERGHYVEFATHDRAWNVRFLEEVVPAAGVGPDRYEVQMLYGVPMLRFQDDLVAGKIGRQGPVRVRVYVPFATSWDHALAYLRRRLGENPTMAFSVGRNLLRGSIGRR
ncbi:MAG: proline dehydrogenase family protein, partial [Planctomycetota bacterium]|nr:proline dehydrogenase family protein [Planctomycetota bacterium]